MKILPYADEPMLLCYHNRAFPFGVVQANSPVDITKWACTKCVFCGFYPNDYNKNFNVSVWDPWGMHEGLVKQQTLEVDRDMLSTFKMDLLHILKEAIHNNCYVKGSFNEKFIPGKWAFNQKTHVHDFLLIGCDDDSFLSVGYLADGRFQRFEIPNQNMADSLYSIGGNTDLKLFSYAEGKEPEPLTERMVGDFKRYLADVDARSFSPKENSYGITAIMRLKDYFVNEVREKGKIYVDNRYSRALYEHAWIMTKLIDSFLEENEKKGFQEATRKNFERAQRIHMLGLKMGYTRNASLIDRVESLMSEIIEEEIKFVPSLTDILQEKYPTD